MNPATIAYISESSPDDKLAWSGTVHYVYKALLNEGFNVIALGPEKPGATRIILAAINKLSLLLFKKRYDYRHSVLYSKAFGNIFNKKLKNIEYDLIVVCGNTECGAYVESAKPIYYILDRTIQGALNYHTILSNLWEGSKDQSIKTDKRAMLNAGKVFFSSQWAAEHAKNFYNLTQKKISVIPFGANLDQIPSKGAAKREVPSSWKLLLVGTYWLNKGADIAYNTLCILREKGLDVSLTVVGCTPPSEINDKDLTIIPFVDKNSEKGREQLAELFLSHQFFILPTRFDCTPIVFCEASAFGLPILSADTGGVRGHIKENVNGFLIPYEDMGEGYANKILALTKDTESYLRLCSSTRELFEEQLNWKTWAEKFRKEIASS